MRPLPILGLLLAPIILQAQDLRSVAEPVFPPACVQLPAASLNPPADETRLDTARIQSALNACSAGQAVQLQAAGANNAFLSGPLQIPKEVTLLIDPGVTLLASRNPRDYDSNASHTCGTLQTASGGCVPFITANRADGGGIMGYGTIDGRGNQLMLPDGVPSPMTWWQLARSASGSLTQNNPRLIQISNTDAFTMYKITIRNSPNFHVAMGTCSNFTAWGVKIVTPYDARNTDGIDPGYSSNVTITHSYISEGDDNVAVGGSSNPGAKNISVVNNWFGDGHGASIGSYTQAGVSDILFDHITIAGQTANTNAIGMRIKSDVSRGGLVQRVTYSNICLRQVRAAIVLDPFYTAGATGTLMPQFKDIVFRNIHATTEGTVKIQGHDATVPTTVTLDNVQIDNIKTSDLTQSYVNYTLGPDPVNFASMLRGTGVDVTNNIATANPPYSCPAEVFSPLPGEIIPGPDPSSVMIQLIPAKANLPAPTGTVTLSNGVSATLAGTAILTIAVPDQPETLTATYSGDANYAAMTFGSYRAKPGARLVTGGIVNAASYAGGGTAPGSLFSIFGTGFASSPKVRVTAQGAQYEPRILYASDTQINAVLPKDIPTGSAEVIVDNSNPSTLFIPVSNFALFPPVQNENYQLNTAQTPAKPGEIVILWGTGLGTETPQLTVAGQPAELVYAGPQSQFEGVENIYFRVPAGTPPQCRTPVEITLGARPTVRTNIAVATAGSPCI